MGSWSAGPWSTVFNGPCRSHRRSPTSATRRGSWSGRPRCAPGRLRRCAWDGLCGRWSGTAASLALLLVLIVGFLLLQGVLDGRDPKLALARVRTDLSVFQQFPGPEQPSRHW